MGLCNDAWPDLLSSSPQPPPVQKLASSGVTLALLRVMDDTTLRKAGVVIKAQRDKIRDAVQLLE